MRRLSSCSCSPAEGQGPSLPGGAGRGRVPRPLAPTAVWEKIQCARTRVTEAPLLESVSDSPGHSGIVAMGWVPGDEEGPCCAPRATSSLRAGRMGLGQSSDAHRAGPKAIYIPPRFSASVCGSLEWPRCFPHLGLTQLTKHDCGRKHWRPVLEWILGDATCGSLGLRASPHLGQRLPCVLLFKETPGKQAASFPPLSGHFPPLQEGKSYSCICPSLHRWETDLALGG